MVAVWRAKEMNNNRSRSERGSVEVELLYLIVLWKFDGTAAVYVVQAIIHLV